jgi:hypothetical protein
VEMAQAKQSQRQARDAGCEIARHHTTLCYSS